MLIVYDSMTGNVQRFVDKLNLTTTRLRDELIVGEPYILVTYTIGFGEVPESTIKFLESNHKYLLAVASSGNMNWGSNFGKAADKIANKFNVPVLMKFELSGTSKDIDKFKQEVMIFDN